MQTSSSDEIEESRYKTPRAGRDDLLEGFNYWSGEVHKRALEISFAIIAGVWAITQGKATTPSWLMGAGLLALAFSFLLLADSLIFSQKMTNLHEKRYEWARSNRDEWLREFENRMDPDSSWPYSREIEKTGESFRKRRIWYPTAGTFFLAIYGVLVMLTTTGLTPGANSVSPTPTEESLPKTGVLPTADSAVRIAEAILVSTYGPQVLNERPFIASAVHDEWTVNGTYHCLKNTVCKVGGAQVRLKMRDAQVVELVNGK